MSYRDLANENWATADGALDAGFVNAAASRYYYAMFHAALHRYGAMAQVAPEVLQGMRTPGGWDHRRVAARASAIRGVAADRWLLREMRQVRNDADYEEVGIDPARLRGRLEAVRRFLEAALA